MKIETKEKSGTVALNKRSSVVLFLLVAAVGGWWWTHRAAPLVNASPHAGPIVAFGDSLTSGVGADAGRGYVDQLGRLIGRPVINRGVPGNTIADAAGRLQSDVLDLRPALVIVLLGGNDMLRRRDINESFADLKRIVERIQRSGAVVVLVGLQGLSPIGGVAGRYKALARQTGCVFVPDILDGIFGNPKLLSDHLHPNSDGYAIMAERIAEAIRPFHQAVPFLTSPNRKGYKSMLTGGRSIAVDGIKSPRSIFRMLSRGCIQS
jgi:lysophospholipase L1-like esterase